MRVAAQYEQCAGHTLCNAVAPRVFGLNDEGNIVLLIEGKLPADLEHDAAAGVGARLERALSVEPGPTTFSAPERDHA